MATCIVNRNEKNGLINSISIKNPNNNLIVAIERNGNHPLELAPNGEPSILYDTLTTQLNMSSEDAKQMIAYTYSNEFGEIFGRWWEDPNNSSKVVDANGQPMIVWSGQLNDGTFEGYKGYRTLVKNNVGEDRINKSAFFVEDRRIAYSYAAGESVDFTRVSKSQEKLYEAFITGHVEPVFLNIRNYKDVPVNGIPIIPEINQSIKDGYDGFYGNRTQREEDGKVWTTLDGEQVITPFIEGNNILSEEFSNETAPEIFDNEKILSEKLIVRNTTQEKTQIKEGVSEVFKENPELSVIGTQEQYSQYLDTIFPDSKVKDIVYHGSNVKFDVFDFTKEKTDPFTKDGAYFATTPYGYKEKLPAILNIKNPKEFGDITDTSNKFGELEKSTEFDSAIGKSTAPNYENYREYVVFEPEQIHILGSKQDIEGFKNYVNNNQTQEVKAEKQIQIQQNETIPSQLFEELRSIPFITEEQALEIYKETHSDKMNFWKDSNLNCK